MADSVTVRVVVTLDDQLRMVERHTRTPAFRRRYWTRTALFVFVLPPLALLVGWTAAFVGDARHGPLLATLAGDLPSFWRPDLVVTGLVIALLVLERLTRRRRLRRATARLLRGRPGIDPADPALGEAAEVTLDASGFTSRTATGEARIPWTTIGGLDEDDRMLVLETRGGNGFVLPTAGLAAAELAAIRRIAAAGIATATGSPPIPTPPPSPRA